MSDAFEDESAGLAVVDGPSSGSVKSVLGGSDCERKRARDPASLEVETEFGEEGGSGGEVFVCRETARDGEAS